MGSMERNWEAKGFLEISVQRLLDQARAIKTNDYSRKTEHNETRMKV